MFAIANHHLLYCADGLVDGDRVHGTRAARAGRAGVALGVVALSMVVGTAGRMSTKVACAVQRRGCGNRLVAAA